MTLLLISYSTVQHGAVWRYDKKSCSTLKTIASRLNASEILCHSLKGKRAQKSLAFTRMAKLNLHLARSAFLWDLNKQQS